jgi:hypothetical protein
MVKTKGYRIPKERLNCKFGVHYNDRVPMPFGSGNCDMPGFECVYDGDKEIPKTCEENSECPVYEPEETIICPKHDIEYRKGEWCDMCHPEMEEYS